MTTNALGSPERPYETWVNDLAVDPTPRERVALTALTDGVRLMWHLDGVYSTREETLAHYSASEGGKVYRPVMWNRKFLFKNWELA